MFALPSSPFFLLLVRTTRDNVKTSSFFFFSSIVHSCPRHELVSKNIRTCFSPAVLPFITSPFRHELMLMQYVFAFLHPSLVIRAGANPLQAYVRSYFRAYAICSSARRASISYIRTVLTPPAPYERGRKQYIPPFTNRLVRNDDSFSIVRRFIESKRGFVGHEFLSNTRFPSSCDS